MNKSVELIAMSKAWVRALAVAALVGLPAAVYGAGVAMVTDLQGKATTSVDGRARDVTILAERLAASSHERYWRTVIGELGVGEAVILSHSDQPTDTPAHSGSQTD